jgi:hypothetical protein
MTPSINLTTCVVQLPKMKKKLNTNVCLAILCVCLFSCNKRPRLDLANLSLREKAKDLIDYGDRYFGGINSMEAPKAFALQSSGSNSFTFNGKPIDSVGVIFLLMSDRIRKDTTLDQGVAIVNQDPVKDMSDLKLVLAKFKADSSIYGYRLTLRTKSSQTIIAKELTTLYGGGTQIPKVDNSFYWNLEDLHRYVFYSPVYRELIVVDNTHLSKNCFWDPSFGTIDLGGCDIDQYKAELLK